MGAEDGSAPEGSDVVVVHARVNSLDQSADLDR